MQRKQKDQGVERGEEEEQEEKQEEEEKEEKELSGSVLLGISPQNLRIWHSHLHLRQRAGASTQLGLPGFPPPHSTQMKQACRGMKINFRYISELLYSQFFLLQQIISGHWTGKLSALTWTRR